MPPVQLLIDVTIRDMRTVMNTGLILAIIFRRDGCHSFVSTKGHSGGMQQY